MNEAAQRAASSTLEPEEMEKQQKILHMLKAADQRLSELQRAYQSP